MLDAENLIGQIAGMDLDNLNAGSEAPPLLPGWAIWGGLGVLLATAVAAPFYQHVMGGLIWAGETIQALCGW